MNNHLAKAKKWAARTAGTAALAVLPLAAISSAQADVTLPTSGYFSNSGFGLPDPSGTISQLPLSNGISGVEFEITSYELTTDSPNFEMGVFGTLGGSGTISAGTEVPFSVSFDLTATGGTLSNVRANLYSSSGYPNYNTFFSISGPISLTQNGTTYSTAFSLPLQSDLVAGGNFDFTFYIYTDSVTSVDATFSNFHADVNPVPEPRTVGLVVVSAAGFFVYWFARRRQTVSC